MTKKQLNNILSQKINESSHLTFGDLLKIGEEIDREFVHLYILRQNIISLISEETGEIVSEIPIKNYNGQKFPEIKSTNYEVSIN